MERVTVRGFVAVVVFMAVVTVLLFGPAGTLRWWQGWVYLAVLTTISAVNTLLLARRDPALLERRMRGGPLAEKRPVQRQIMWFAALGWVGLQVIPALDARFGWSRIPAPLVILGDVLVVVGNALVGRVFAENTFTSATIGVVPGQRVISTGPYAIVRHPMYASSLLYLAGTPLALGSWWGFLAFAEMIPFLIWRLLDEERALARDLPGYAEYCRTVRNRLIPRVW